MMLEVASHYDKLATYAEKLERERLTQPTRNSN